MAYAGCRSEPRPAVLTWAFGRGTMAATLSQLTPALVSSGPPAAPTIGDSNTVSG
jgi:hypothetical protein